MTKEAKKIDSLINILISKYNRLAKEINSANEKLRHSSSDSETRYFWHAVTWKLRILKITENRILELEEKLFDLTNGKKKV